MIAYTAAGHISDERLFSMSRRRMKKAIAWFVRHGAVRDEWLFWTYLPVGSLEL